MKYTWILCTVIINIAGCVSSPNKNPFEGKWTSAWVKQAGKVDLSIEFKENYSFTTIAFQDPIRLVIDGNYFVSKDSFFIKDNHHEPTQLCSYDDTGRYKYVYRNDSLFFKVIHENCEKRKYTFEIGLVRLKE
ncbi:MAG TPA: hypothetical protein VM101_05830 [Flavitalea sp.]|nr:hypothetical protein [Flavitalea sp.]